MFYLVQRMGAESFRPAIQINSEYAKTFTETLQTRVEVLVY